MGVALDGDADVLAVGVYYDQGFNERNTKIKKSGSVFMLAFDDTDFSNGRVVSRIGAGYRYNDTVVNKCQNGACGTFVNDFNTQNEPDLILAEEDHFGLSLIHI